MTQNKPLPRTARVSVVIEYDLDELRAEGNPPDDEALNRYLKETFLGDVFRTWLGNDITVEFVTE